MGRMQIATKVAQALLVLALIGSVAGCSKHWTTFRHDAQRTGNQPHRSALSDPTKIANLKVVWTFSAPGGQGFYSSAIVHDHKIYIGNGNGIFYALSEQTGAILWQYPSGTPLTSTFTCNPSSIGIASTATYARVKGKEAVIFGAPDPASGAHLGDGHLFALDAESGVLLWESPPVAQVTGSGFNDLHEQIGYSAPLVFNDRVYIGIADHCDNPIQNGRVVAVHLNDGTVDSGFNYVSTSSGRGGGVWNTPTASEDVFVTTGNTASGNPSQPAVNHGLSLLRLDKASGAVKWQHQPVPYDMDNDPDWSAGAVVMNTSCGRLVTSQQKDGWAWSVDASSGSVKWAFPTGPWATSGFHLADGTVHGDTDYKRPGAAWGDVYVAVVGGLDTVTNLSAGYTQLHALNVCAPENRRIRWLKDVPATGGFTGYPLGPPSVTRGIVYVGTNEGHLIVLADPQVVAAAGWRCSDPSVPLPTCALLGSLGSVIRLVPDPTILKDIALPGATAIFGEPVLVGDHVIIADQAGKLFLLDAS
jgi:outer membrane protein assembly factor BamB